MAYFIINWDFDTSDTEYDEKSTRASSFCKANMGIRISQSTWMISTTHALEEVLANFERHVRGSVARLLAPKRDSSDWNELCGGDHVNVAELAGSRHTDTSVLTWMQDPYVVLSREPAPSE